jgi:hypothetical protein
VSVKKYLILRTKDVQQFLQPEQKQQLLAIMKTINAGRQEMMLEDDFYFPLNVRDLLAQDALETYISSGQKHREYSNHDGLRAAVAAAQEAREKGIMAGEPRLPEVA